MSSATAAPDEPRPATSATARTPARRCARRQRRHRLDRRPGARRRRRPRRPRAPILTAGLAGLVAGAMSMAVGEYVSVSTQRDTERAAAGPRSGASSPTDPEGELRRARWAFTSGKGLTPDLARQVAEQLHAGPRPSRRTPRSSSVSRPAHRESLERGDLLVRLVHPGRAAAAGRDPRPAARRGAPRSPSSRCWSRSR